jgi:hypothetical protein
MLPVQASVHLFLIVSERQQRGLHGPLLRRNRKVYPTWTGRTLYEKRHVPMLPFPSMCEPAAKHSALPFVAGATFGHEIMLLWYMTNPLGRSSLLGIKKHTLRFRKK